MYCPHCMKKLPQSAQKCMFCAQPTHTPVAGMATLRISCRPRVPVWMMVMQPLCFFFGYKVHISVDDKNYMLKSKKKQIDIPVSIGTHVLRVSSISKKGAKALKFAGAATSFVGVATGSGATVYAGAAVNDIGRDSLKNGFSVSFSANELVPIAVKLAWNGSIVEDEKE